MLKRILSLFLMPCVLIAQSAGVGHSHDDLQQEGHNLRPHIHLQLSLIASHYDHPQSHPHGNGNENQQSDPLSDHDADAIFFDVDTVLTERCSICDDSGTSQLPYMAGAILDIAFLQDSLLYPHFRWPHPPPWAETFCPLYLQFLAILI